MNRLIPAGVAALSLAVAAGAPRAAVFADLSAAPDGLAASHPVLNNGLYMIDADPFAKDLVILGGFTGANRMVVVTTDFGRVANDDFAFVPGPLPEPAGWTLMIAGLGAAGALLRWRRTAAA